MKALDTFRAQLPETFRFQWLANGIGLITAQHGSYIVRDYGKNGFDIYQSLPFGTVGETVQNLIDQEDAYERCSAHASCLAEAANERRQMGVE